MNLDSKPALLKLNMNAVSYLLLIMISTEDISDPKIIRVMVILVNQEA